MNAYNSYLDTSFLRLKSVIEDMGCRPILFVGAGLSRRYIDGPSWYALLEHLVRENPKLDKPIEFYYQKAGGDLPTLATLLEDDYQSYAWDNYETGLFPSELYDRKYSKSIFIKYKIAELFTTLLNNYPPEAVHKYNAEIDLIASLEPHSVITTNYDQFLEKIFPNFTTVVGQQIIKKPVYSDIGEILKIHGCVSDPQSIVISENDYDEFIEKKKYLSAKLLTYFIEHPVIILGYSVSDPNIKSILSDISKMVPSGPDELVENIWFVEWNEECREDRTPPSEKIIDLGEGRTIRVNYIQVDRFNGLYEHVSQPVAVRQVNVKLLRALMSNVYDIVKNKSARSSLEVNIATLNGLITDEGKLMNILGFGSIESPDMITTLYPFSLSEVAKELGYDHWYNANELIKKVKEETGFDIKSSNNEYHIDAGLNGQTVRHYSPKTIQLLTLVRDCQQYYVINDQGLKIEVPAPKVLLGI